MLQPCLDHMFFTAAAQLCYCETDTEIIWLSPGIFIYKTGNGLKLIHESGLVAEHGRITQFY